jgi:hypothetical protein
MGSAAGAGMLGLVGTGVGGGGKGEGTIALGNLGTIGKGGGAGSAGVGYGRVATLGNDHLDDLSDSLGYYRAPVAARSAAAPEVKVASSAAVIHGSLDRESIRRIVRLHLNEVRFCYERALAKNAGLAGRVELQLTIADSGAVVASTVQSTTLGNADPNGEVERCVADAARRWTFPRVPGGGVLTVHYPFVFQPSEPPPPPRPSPVPKLDDEE